MLTIGIGKALIVIGIATIVTSHPSYSWGMQKSNYDASLDPIAWSRDFVKDSIRKPRQFRNHVLLHNSLDEGEDEIMQKSHNVRSYSLNEGEDEIMQKSHNLRSYGFGKRHSSKANYADYTNTWYGEPSTRKRNTMRNKFYRRRHNLDAHDRYGFV